MENCIRLLPEIVANQIAAGEVVQQPSSAVKELVENAIDAGATHIEVTLKDAGKTLIQVVDNGKGMSPEDALRCFDRHATSKIQQADDLFHIQTKGFRGEALASIAAIAQVELQTRPADEELGTRVMIAGGRVESHESIVMDPGTRFMVRNLFFNVPARRKFLGNNSKLFYAIRSEFVQLALAHSSLRMTLIHNGELVLRLNPGNLRQRIVAIFGESFNKKLFPVEAETECVRVHGFVGHPEAAHKRSSDQYFFANNRFIRHPYFRKAVMNVYEPLMEAGKHPLFFLFLEVSPDSIDVNVSPTKTEVKFENEQIIWPILQAAVRESLGRFNAVPSIDFDKDDAPNIDVFRNDVPPTSPQIQYDNRYNPFQKNNSVEGWQALYQPPNPRNDSSLHDAGYRPSAEDDSCLMEAEAIPTQQTQALFSENETKPDLPHEMLQVFDRFIVVPMGDCLLFIDQHRAHVAILYDHYLQQLEHHQVHSQSLLFPEPLALDLHLHDSFESVRPDLNDLGFVFEQEQGNYFICAVPEHLNTSDANQVVLDLMDAAHEGEGSLPMTQFERLALRLASSAALPYYQKLSFDHMYRLCQDLFQCRWQNFTPDGKPIIVRKTAAELIKLF